MYGGLFFFLFVLLVDALNFASFFTFLDILRTFRSAFCELALVSSEGSGFFLVLLLRSWLRDLELCLSMMECGVLLARKLSLDLLFDYTSSSVRRDDDVRYAYSS